MDENILKAKTFLQQILTSLSKKNKRTFFTLNVFFCQKKTITQINILKKRTKSPKTGNGLGNLYVGDCN